MSAVILEEPVRGVFTYAQYPGGLALPGFEQMRRFQLREFEASAPSSTKPGRRTFPFWNGRRRSRDPRGYGPDEPKDGCQDRLPWSPVPAEVSTGPTSGVALDQGEERGGDRERPPKMLHMLIHQELPP